MLATRGQYSYDGVTAIASRPPLYAALIAVLMRITSHPHAAILGVQALLGSITVALAASLAYRAFGHRAGLLAGIAMAIAPLSGHFAAAVLSETLFTFLVVLAMWLWQDNRVVAAGVAMGLSALTRSVGLPLVLALAIVGILFRKTALQRQCLPIAVVALLTTAPWIVRNVVQLGQVTISDGSWGSALAYGSVELHSGSNHYTQVEQALGFTTLRAGIPSGPDRQGPAIDLFLQRVRTAPWAWIRARASQYPWLLIDTGDYLPVRANATPFFRAMKERNFAPIILKLLFIGGNVFVLAMCAYGLWSERARAGALLPLWLLPAVVLAA